MSGKTEIAPSLYGQVFSKNTDNTVDKAVLLISTFGEAADPKNFLAQSKATNIQHMTLSLIFSIAIHATFEGWTVYKLGLRDEEVGP
ncbi:hypothetical protein C1646_765138 [Rhizophagus diaphanus]|nr:hypothetical protein C1646_765138 [Rhizophagus diaphanus] [Rhizophagus sp. MUCL 43196]